MFFSSFHVKKTVDKGIKMGSRIAIAVMALLFLTTAFLRKIEENKKLGVLNAAYLFFLFSFYPIVFSPIQGYGNMGTFKARILAVATTALLIYEIVFIFIFAKKTGELNDLFINSSTDIAMLLYLIAATVSFFAAENKKTALVGADGWFTGLLFQYGIVAVYFSISRFAYVRDDRALPRWFFRILMISGVAIFTIGVLHRFLIDPLGIYRFLTEEDYPRFLSTIGQATWYSSYLCLVFPIGLHCFIFSDIRLDKYISGAFLLFSAATLVTQNSDSAYAAIFGIVICYIIYLFAIGNESKDKAIRFGIAIIIMSASILLIGICERMFASRFVMLDDLSKRIAQGLVPIIGLFVGALLIAIAGANRRIKRCFAVGIGILLLSIGFIVVFRTASDTYFSLGRNWGNGRGLIWMRTVQMYADLPLKNKIFGIGPGMFDERIRQYTELVLANAHNEWLTALVEYGMIGGILYLAIFVISVAGMIRNIRLDRADGQVMTHFEYAMIAATVAYLIHGMFNYQQCISTPMLFALTGLYSSYKGQHVKDFL